VKPGGLIRRDFGGVGVRAKRLAQSRFEAETMATLG